MRSSRSRPGPRLGWPESFPGGSIPAATLSFELMWREETPSSALAELIRLAAGYTQRPPTQSPAGGGRMRPFRGARLLSAEEEVTLARRIARGDRQAKERMIESNLRLVHAIARLHRNAASPTPISSKREPLVWSGLSSGSITAVG